MSAREFWDQRAREDALFFVDTRLAYGGADADREVFWSRGEEDLDRLLAETGMRVDPGSTILDIGCGVGRLSRAAAARAGRVIALDVSAEMIARAREHNSGLKNVTWLVGDGERLTGVGDASVDGCVSLVVFQHIPDPEITLGYLREVGRVLRPGGWAALQISTDETIHRPRTGLEGLRIRLRALLGRGPRGQADPAWLGSAVPLPRIEETVTAAGMSIERVTGAGTQYCLVGLRRAGD